ncbi:MAG: glycerol-3-phosphate 1-O-acyltransferase PlsY [Acetobacteraceae bacterium]
MELLLAALFGGLLGSIPFGLVLTRAAGLGDIRQIGSGNIGATNVLRTGNKGLAAATLLLDGAKGAVAVLVAGALWADPWAAPVAGFAAMLGHLFPPWLGFKGGKGVATGLGVLLAAAPWAGLAACGVWLAAAVVTRISSASALTAIVASPALCLALADWRAAVLALAMAVPIVWRHEANIRRLLAGTEPRIGERR